jgi:hypothetical protein
MELHCPQCESSDLKKVSLAYQEGLFQTQGSTRVKAAVVGGAGPALVLGRATTRASHQSALSKRVSPPAKWSYLKVGSWSVLVLLCVGWLVFYVNKVTTNATTALSVPVALIGLVAAVSFFALMSLAWKHNRFTYTQRYAEWDSSFICQRCGALNRITLNGEHGLKSLNQSSPD